MPKDFIFLLDNEIVMCACVVQIKYQDIKNDATYFRKFIKRIIDSSTQELKKEFCNKTYNTPIDSFYKMQEDFLNKISTHFKHSGFCFSFEEEQKEELNHYTYKSYIKEEIKLIADSYLPLESQQEADDLKEEINDFLAEQDEIVNSSSIGIEDAIMEARDIFYQTDMSEWVYNFSTIYLPKNIMVPNEYVLDDYFPLVKPEKFMYSNLATYQRELENWEKEFKWNCCKNVIKILKYRIKINKHINEIENIIKEKSSKNIVFYEDEEKCKYNISNCICHVVNAFLSEIKFPQYLKFGWDINYDLDNKLLLIDFDLPNSSDFPCYKDCKRIVKSTKEVKLSLLNSLTDKTIEKKYEDYIYSFVLNVIEAIFNFEISLKEEAQEYADGEFLNDYIENIAINGSVKYIDVSDGQHKESCILSLLVDEKSFSKVNLENVDYRKCFKKLKGISSNNLSENIAIVPVLSFNKKDKRFIESKEVIGTLDESVNIAAMDWKDFENLVRDIFEKEFSAEGLEVKITQSSHDGGVDAVVFDPDPIKGGKIVIQAKRYTNVVHVSAVRDLYGTIHNEGANKGILVTTSDFGTDSHNFAQNKPITLINGNQLLYLLEKHNVKAKIDLKEAKKILAQEVSSNVLINKSGEL